MNPFLTLLGGGMGAPVPAPNVPQPKPSFLDRLRGAAGDINQGMSRMDPMMLATLGAGILSANRPMPGNVSPMTRIGMGVQEAMPMMMGAQRMKAMREQQKMMQDERASISKLASEGLKNLDADQDGVVSPQEAEIGNILRAASATGDRRLLAAATDARLSLMAPKKQSPFSEQVDMVMRANPNMSMADAVNAVLNKGKSSTTVNVNTDRQQPTPATATEIQKNILGAQKLARELQGIGDVYSDEYLSLSGRFKSAMGELIDKINMGDPTGWAQFNAQRGKFVQRLRQFFLRYRKEITGVAGGEKEMADILESMINETLGPQEFKSRFDDFFKMVDTNLAANQQAAREGIAVGGSGPTPPAPVDQDPLGLR